MNQRLSYLTVDGFPGANSKSYYDRGIDCHRLVGLLRYLQSRVGIEHNRMGQYQGWSRREYVREEAGHQVRNVFSRKEVVRSSGRILT
jgi:hypothetical protein